MIYFDNASTTYVYPEVAKAIQKVITEYWGNPMNLYTFGMTSALLVDKARAKIAKAINADPEEIIFTSCSSESNALAIAQAKRCFCSAYEHHDIKENPKTSVVDEDYLFRLEKMVNSFALERQNAYESYLFAHMAINNETGEIFDLRPLIDVSHRLKMRILIDATQALGNVPIDVKELDVDYMSFSFHKVHAPKGIGALYVKKELKKDMKPLIYGTQEFGLRGGTSNVPYIVGAGMAVEQAVKEMERKNAHTEKLRNYIITELLMSQIPMIINQGENNIPSILNIAFKGITGESMVLALDEHDICVSTGSACNSGDLKPSEVLTAMKVPEKYIQGAMRISMSLENTMEEAQTLCREIKRCYKELS